MNGKPLAVYLCGECIDAKSAAPTVLLTVLRAPDGDRLEFRSRQVDPGATCGLLRDETLASRVGTDRGSEADAIEQRLFRRFDRNTSAALSVLTWPQAILRIAEAWERSCSDDPAEQRALDRLGDQLGGQLSDRFAEAYRRNYRRVWCLEGSGIQVNANTSAVLYCSKSNHRDQVVHMADLFHLLNPSDVPTDRTQRPNGASPRRYGAPSDRPPVRSESAKMIGRQMAQWGLAFSEAGLARADSWATPGVYFRRVRHLGSGGPVTYLTDVLISGLET